MIISRVPSLSNGSSSPATTQTPLAVAQDIFIHVCLSPLARHQRLHLGEGAEATGGHTEILSPQLALVQRQQLSVLVLLDALGLDAVREDLRHLTRPIDVPAKGVQVVLSG